MSVPDWVQDAIFYQIFPDRFANGDTKIDPPNVKSWGSTPTAWAFQGGDIKGILQKLDYLVDLGINAIYLNPIFQSSSTHRYNTTDYFRIDPMLGDIQDFHNLIKAAHSHHIRVILDGVFNHCGRGFFAFNDILENQENSPYRDWFHVMKFPPDAYSPGDAKDYLAWWGFKSLPKFNTSNPAVRRYIFSVARFWIEQGVDGWRLDVPNEIDDDSFWAEFRQTVKAVNPDAYLLGEIWSVDPRWVGETHFDGLMNYPFRDAILRYLHAGTFCSTEFADRIDALLKAYPRENTYAMYLPLGSHDVERLVTKLQGDLRVVKLAYLFQFAFPGAPAIYYGDEIGLSGGKDPENRGAFIWDESQWNEELRSWIKNLISVRKKLPALRRGEFLRVLSDDQNCAYAHARILDESRVLCVINASNSSANLNLPVSALGWEDGKILHNLLGRKKFVVTDGNLPVAMPPWEGMWIG